MVVDARRLDDASDHILSFLDSRDVLVCGTAATYKQLHETLDIIVDSGYFTRPIADDSCRNDDDHAVETNGNDLHGTWNIRLCECWLISDHVNEEDLQTVC